MYQMNSCSLSDIIDSNDHNYFQTPRSCKLSAAFNQGKNYTLSTPSNVSAEHTLPCVVNSRNLSKKNLAESLPDTLCP
jgi:hypothetical protein